MDSENLHVPPPGCCAYCSAQQPHDLASCEVCGAQTIPVLAAPSLEETGIWLSHGGEIAAWFDLSAGSALVLMPAQGAVHGEQLLRPGRNVFGVGGEVTVVKLETFHTGCVARPPWPAFGDGFLVEVRLAFEAVQPARILQAFPRPGTSVLRSHDVAALLRPRVDQALARVPQPAHVFDDEQRRHAEAVLHAALVPSFDHIGLSLKAVSLEFSGLSQALLQCPDAELARLADELRQVRRSTRLDQQHHTAMARAAQAFAEEIAQLDFQARQVEAEHALAQRLQRMQHEQQVLLTAQSQHLEVARAETERLKEDITRRAIQRRGDLDIATIQAEIWQTQVPLLAGVMEQVFQSLGFSAVEGATHGAALAHECSTRIQQSVTQAELPPETPVARLVPAPVLEWAEAMHRILQRTVIVCADGSPLSAAWRSHDHHFWTPNSVWPALGPHPDLHLQIVGEGPTLPVQLKRHRPERARIELSLNSRRRLPPLPQSLSAPAWETLRTGAEIALLALEDGRPTLVRLLLDGTPTPADGPVQTWPVCPLARNGSFEPLAGMPVFTQQAALLGLLASLSPASLTLHLNH